MPQAWEQAIIVFLEQLFHSIGWFGVVVIMALESANIPIPSEVTMPLAGWLLVQARGGQWWQALLLGGLWGAVGCTLGASISYWVGYFGGRPLVERFGRFIMVHPNDISRAERWYTRWGNLTAFFSRMLPIVRTFIAFPAGVLRVPFWRFTLLGFIGSYIWCSLLALGGFYFGANWEELRAIMRPFDIPIAIIILVGMGYYVYRHVTHGMRRHDNTSSTEPEATPAE